ncbi:shikimate dehydrogenase [Kitasatospora sp. GP82]|uniref:shikimate dehydrogenase n=1 Tax=Kitasatospora sp. GP82 TaxID=3035089 RepID=UPI002475366F|nr:shikimate dehydrogenase [Kitasatospora sp. GP82]MDH6123561.1 shikimate dehydrogenase [Kitasatospora sp. GP82]
MRADHKPVVDHTRPSRRTAARAAVLGSSIGQSLSPTLHRAAYAAMGLDWDFEAIECDESTLHGMLDARNSSWAGLALAMPLKRAALPWIDEVTDLALDVGGVNTVAFRKGRTFGDNTDAHGIALALREAGVDTPSSALVLGGGATASSALAALRELGIREPGVVVREHRRATEAQAAAGRLGMAVDVHTFDRLDELLHSAGLVISTLPAGAADQYAAAIMHSRAAVLDVVPSAWPTRLAKAAGFAGSTVVDGLSMLVHQAARQVALITGHSDVPVAAMREAGQTELARRAG